MTNERKRKGNDVEDGEDGMEMKGKEADEWKEDEMKVKMVKMIMLMIVEKTMEMEGNGGRRMKGR